MRSQQKMKERAFYMTKNTALYGVDLNDQVR